MKKYTYEEKNRLLESEELYPSCDIYTRDEQIANVQSAYKSGKLKEIPEKGDRISVISLTSAHRRRHEMLTKGMSFRVVKVVRKPYKNPIHGENYYITLKSNDFGDTFQITRSDASWVIVKRKEK